jgi:sugar porter (SP) family MFS transporter
MFQFNIVFGILIAFLSNYLLSGLGVNAWRWMLGIMAIPALIYSLACLSLPESPRWLVLRRSDEIRALAVLQRSDPEATDAERKARLVEFRSASSSIETSSGDAIRRLRKPILLAFLIAFFNQLSGINAVLYFAPRIFELSGLGAEAALLQSVGIGLTNLVFTFVGLWLIDHLGRRTLLLIGSVGYIASLGLCSAAFFTQSYGLVPVCVFAFIAAHAVGQGAVIWVFISEIFPSQYRALGQSLGSFTHWIFAALLTTYFPLMVTEFAPGSVFLFFAMMMAIQLIWVLIAVPETKGVPLEEMEKKLGISM